MRTKVSRLNLVLALVCLAGSPPAAALVPLFGLLTVLAPAAGAQEVNAPCSDAQVPMCYGERAQCSISPASDLDVYQFAGIGGEKVRLTVSGQSNDLDPLVQIFNPDGSLHSGPSCGAGCCSPCSFRHDFDLMMTGLHTLVVSDSGLNNTGNYALDLQRIPPLAPPPTLDYGQSKSVSLEHPSDHDWLQIELSTGTHVRVTATGHSNDLDVLMELFDSAGNKVAQSTCSAGCCTPCSTQFDLAPVAADGTYYLAVSDAGNNNTGSASITLTCILGMCPPPAPPGPLGASYCVQTPNSAGSGAVISGLGSPVVADNDVLLMATGAPAGQVGVFFYGFAPAAIPYQGTTICVQPPVVRLPAVFVCNAGSMVKGVDLTAHANIQPGLSAYFQAWFRDPAGPSMTNTSDGLRIDFQ